VIVALSYTSINPYAVMIHFRNTFVTKATVFRSGWFYYFTSSADIFHFVHKSILIRFKLFTQVFGMIFILDKTILRSY